MQGKKLPVFLSVMGLACYKCFKEDVLLYRCGRCLRIVYCSPECQKLDWEKHKPLCKALGAIPRSNPKAPEILSLPRQPTTDLTIVQKITETDMNCNLAFCTSSLKREPYWFEMMLIIYEPRCIACARTHNLIRMEATKNGTTAKPLVPCSQCKLTFCCSAAHWHLARRMHDAPCEDARDALSQCQMNKELCAHIKFVGLMADALDSSGEYIWAPERLNSVWLSLSGLSWESELGDELRKSLDVPASRPITPWIRLASNSLSRAMTILYGLENLNDDDEWTRKHTLTIHIIGATDKEVSLGKVFEEILHRLPEVKTLKLVLCGPHMPGRRSASDFEICVECTKLGRQRIHEHADCFYHDFVRSKGSEFQKPDLCIAFNSGASQSSMETWPATFQVLVAREIPSLFTSYNREEAEADAALLHAAGATLIPALGPAKNPWGSIHVTPVPVSLRYDFHAVNGWLAGGFR
ncbi:hypothetical protein B0H19DRAFT_1137355 [Mycena capillaripes]|nr:hypothetical protein B0H19DRAFT_1137355 [Mycena capillaripes]